MNIRICVLLAVFGVTACNSAHVPFFGDEPEPAPLTPSEPKAALFCYETLADAGCYLTPDYRHPDRYLAETTIRRSRIAPGIVAPIE